MVTAFVLVNVERANLKEVVEAVLEIKGVSEVYTVAGEYDLVAVVRVKDNKALSKIVVDQMPHHIPGITHTKTLYAFEAHSAVDLEKVFKIQ